MDKKTKRDLERLERLEHLTNAEKSLLSNLYGDLFGSSGIITGNNSGKSGSSSPKSSGSTGTGTSGKTGNSGSSDNTIKRKSSEPSAADLLDRVRKNHPDPLAVQIGNEGTPAVSQSGKKPGQEAVQAGGAGPEAKTEEAPKEPEKDPMEELDALVGLTTIKHDVKELMAFVKIQKMRKDAGLKSVPVSLHLVFTGNPGTGKTTVARIIGRLYKQIGVLSKGQLIEVDRSGLVAGYVGQTALKTQEQICKAMGGVLFIDEAYALAQKDDAFGQEAIDTVLKAMEDHRDDLVVIVAGYTKPMEKFINSNPGLKSRFNKYIEFPDYTVDELVEIFNLNCKKYDYVVEEDAQKQIRARIVSKKMQMKENFANAREVRNMFEDIITNQARRVAAMENPTHEDMMKITVMDLSDDIGEVIDSKEVEKMEAAAREVLTPELELPGEETKADTPAEPVTEDGTPADSKEKAKE